MQIFVRRLKKSLSRAASYTPDRLFARVLGLTIGVGLGKVAVLVVFGLG